MVLAADRYELSYEWPAGQAIDKDLWRAARVPPLAEPAQMRPRSRA